MPSLPQDKANHFLYGALIAKTILLAAPLVGYDPQASALIGVAAIAVLKEASDALINKRATGDPMHGPHGVELLDAVATFTGALVVAL